MIPFCIVYLACCPVKARVKLLAVMKNALELIAREASVLKLHLADILSFQSVYRDHAVSVSAFETPHIINVITIALHSLIEQIFLLS